MYSLHRIPKEYMTVVLKMASKDGGSFWWSEPGILIVGLDHIFPFNKSKWGYSDTKNNEGLISVNNHTHCSECQHIFHLGETIMTEEYTEEDYAYCPYCASRRLKDDISEMVEMLNNIRYG